MHVPRIIPAIIPDSLDTLRARVREVRGCVQRVQLDVMDGRYTATTSWPYDSADAKAFENLRREDEGLPYWQDIDYEVDLMVTRPEECLEEWVLTGAACLIVHVESTEHVPEIIALCRDRRVELGLALKPSTDIERIAPYVEDVVFAQCMGSDRIGAYGVPLEPRALDTIRALVARYPKLSVGVDIGVNESTLPALCAAGATRFAVGSAIFTNPSPRRAYGELDSLAAVHLSSPESAA